MKKKILVGILAVVMSVTMIPGNLMEKAGVKKDAEAAVTLQNPRIEADASMEAGQKVTYDCIWFGSYPQTEIVDQASTCGTYEKVWGESSDYEENSSLYTSLKNASGWDSYGDVTINGIKYRRIKTSDATYSTSILEDYYTWNSPDIYHYFRYEPIKWRVLEVKNNQALLLADKGLDVQRFNSTSIDITWKTSTIRSWLNGYGDSSNTCAIDYTSKNFINSAFNSDERGAINSSYLENKTTGPYSDNYGGDSTTDKLFLLSSYDVYDSDLSASYGFNKTGFGKFDAARRAKSSTYAKAMGAYTRPSGNEMGYTCWWLRSPGPSASGVAHVSYNSYVYYGSVNYYDYTARPAFHLNLASSNLYTYAGTVCTDGTIHEEGGGDTPTTYTITYNANGGIDAPQNQIKTRGEDLILSTSEPTKSGYTFMGWGTNSSSTTVSYNKGGTYTSDSNITLYAIWKKTVTLSYDANGGNGGPFAQTGDMYNADTGTNIIISSDKPSRNNYTFLGWSTSSNATSASYTGGNTISIKEDTTLYAVWQENPSTGYTITYNANGGNGAPSPQTKEAGEIITLSKTKPTRNDYEFAGWSTDNTSTDIDYDPEDSYEQDEDLILYAIWKKTITLSYNANGGSGEPSAKSATVYNSETDYTFTISSIEPSRTGYDFLGWGARSNSEYPTYYSGDEITADTDAMIYAVWVKNDSGESGNDNPTPQPEPKAAQTITASNKNIAINSKSVSLGAKAKGKLTYKSSTPSIATISSAGVITPKNYGTTTITIKAAETSTYKAVSKTIKVTVVPKKMTLTTVKSPTKKTLLLKWKRDKDATKYEVQLCMKRDFKEKTLSRRFGKKVVKQEIKNMRSKIWYVRIRAWKKVGGKTYYGIWSKIKKVKIK